MSEVHHHVKLCVSHYLSQVDLRFLIYTQYSPSITKREFVHSCNIPHLAESGVMPVFIKLVSSSDCGNSCELELSSIVGSSIKIICDKGVLFPNHDSIIHLVESSWRNIESCIMIQLTQTKRYGFGLHSHVVMIL